MVGGPKHFLTVYFVLLSLYFAFIGWSYMAKYSKSNRYSHLSFDKWSGWSKAISVGLVFVGFILSCSADNYFMTFDN